MSVWLRKKHVSFATEKIGFWMEHSRTYHFRSPHHRKSHARTTFAGTNYNKVHICFSIRLPVDCKQCFCFIYLFQNGINSFPCHWKTFLYTKRSMAVCKVIKQNGNYFWYFQFCLNWPRCTFQLIISIFHMYRPRSESWKFYWVFKFWTGREIV